MCNIYAERLKSKGEELSRRTIYILEVVIPSFSALCLTVVTCYITVDAIRVISSNSTDDDIDVAFLFGFAAGNAAIDILSSCYFFLGGSMKDVFYTPVNGKVYDEVDPETILIENPLNDSDSMRARLGTSPSTPSSPASPLASTQLFQVNLNMLSAFAHLSSDSMRTLSVIIAAIVATYTDIPSSLCDAWAAVAVAVTIIAVILPLAVEIYKASLKYRGEKFSLFC